MDPSLLCRRPCLVSCHPLCCLARGKVGGRKTAARTTISLHSTISLSSSQPPLAHPVAHLACVVTDRLLAARPSLCSLPQNTIFRPPFLQQPFEQRPPRAQTRMAARQHHQQEGTLGHQQQTSSRQHRSRRSSTTFQHRTRPESSRTATCSTLATNGKTRRRTFGFRTRSRRRARVHQASVSTIRSTSTTTSG